ncbi:MAG: hypothetical protein ABIN97_16665 [Ginsengibacter sp.]
MKKILVLAFLLCSVLTKAQKVKEIYVNLYTDSLKKGTYNYINVDGLLHNGNYTPLDSTEIVFWASDGKFYGNTLLIDKDFKKDNIAIKVTLKANPAITKEFTMYIKRNEDNEHLKTSEELLKDLQNNSKVKDRKSLNKIN